MITAPMKEQWKPIKGFEQDYDVSNYGNVRNRNWRSPGTVRYLTPTKDKDGYLRVCLSTSDGKQFTRIVHRLVAEAFLENFDLSMTINHKNEIKSDNRIDNLECMTITENNNYGHRNENVSKSKKNQHGKPVKQFTLQGEFVKGWKSLHEIERVLGYNPAAISRVCTGAKKTAYSFRWEYGIVS